MLRRLVVVLAIMFALLAPSPAGAATATLRSPSSQPPICRVTSIVTADWAIAYVQQANTCRTMAMTAYSYVGTVIGTDYFGTGDAGMVNPSPADVYRVRIVVTNLYGYYCIRWHYRSGAVTNGGCNA